MTEAQAVASKSTRSFVIGLAVGLVVGGLAGAFFGEFAGSGIPQVKSAPVRTGGAAPSRDDIPAPAATGPTEAVPPSPDTPK